MARDLRFKYFQRTVGIDQWYLRQFITGTIEMARIRGIGSAFHFRRPPIARAILASARNTSWSGFPGERGRKSRFCFVLVDSAYRHGRAGLRFMWQHIFKASLTIWPYWTFGTPTRRNNAVKDDFVGRLGFRKCRVSRPKSPKLCAKKENTSSRFRSRETNSKLALGNFSNYKIIVARVILTFISFDKNIKVIEQ